jgi:hypothetical protein
VRLDGEHRVKGIDVHTGNDDHVGTRHHRRAVNDTADRATHCTADRATHRATHRASRAELHTRLQPVHSARPDVDCAGGSGNGPRYVNGPVYVTGPDIYDLDRDGNGIGCQ